jgi:hypothetical protein
MMATINMDSVQFYQLPFRTSLFSGKYAASPHIDPKSPVGPLHAKSQALKSVGVIVLDGWGDFGLGDWNAKAALQDLNKPALDTSGSRIGPKQSRLDNGVGDS